MTFFFGFSISRGGQAPPPEHAPDVKALRLTNTVSLSEHIVLHYHSDASNRVYNHTHWEYRNKIVTIIFLAGACPGGGGPRGLGPPPLEIEKQKKGHQSKFQAIHLYYATFLVENIISQLFSELPPSPIKSEKHKKKAFRFWAPPLTNSWTRACLEQTKRCQLLKILLLW